MRVRAATPALRGFAAPTLEAVRAERARRSLLAFTTYTKPNYVVNWHHRVVCERLDALARGDITRMIISMPPRHGKSELVSRRFPAYLLGLNPHEQIIAWSHAAPLAARMNRDVQRIIEDPRYARVFPNTRLAGQNARIRGRTTWLRNSTEFEIVGARGSYRGTGLRGDIVGRGYTLGIIDDPIKNREQADSEAEREKAWELFTSAFYERQEPGNRILITLTRWHEDDIVGRLLRLAAEDKQADQWEVISLPALREEGDDPIDPREVGSPLWPGKYGLGTLLTMRSTIGSREWSAQYQCRPSPGEGGVFKRSWFAYWHRAPGDKGAIVLDRKDGSPARRFLGTQLLRFFTVDVAAGMKQGNDYTVIACWGLTTDRDLVLLDLHRERLEGPSQIKAIALMQAKWKPAWIGVEAVAYQLTLVQALIRKGFPARELRPDRDKVARAQTAAVRMEAGTVWFPLGAPWLSDFEHELLLFPNGAHDDQVDVLSYAAAWVAVQAMESVTISPDQLAGLASRVSPIVGAT
jgi:predicted phage terminase large subunit-like protein